MSTSSLRVYYGPDGEEALDTATDLPQSHSTVTVGLGEILPLLADAVQSERTWLSDFNHDRITISSDLHEVILAYQHFRPSA
jgi:hypothetical protein